MTNEKKDLEQRVKPKLKELPEKLMAFCEFCKSDRIFEFAYVQPGYGLVSDSYLYNCTGCNINRRNTKSYSTLMDKFNGRAVE